MLTVCNKSCREIIRGCSGQIGQTIRLSADMQNPLCLQSKARLWLYHPVGMIFFSTNGEGKYENRLQRILRLQAEVQLPGQELMF